MGAKDGLVGFGDPAVPGEPLIDARRRVAALREDLPTLFAANAVAVISNGIDARVGTLRDDIASYRRWRAIDHEDPAPVLFPDLKTTLLGVSAKDHLLNLLRNFVLFEASDGVLCKRLAAYDQFQAVEVARAATLRATGKQEPRPPFARDSAVFPPAGTWRGKRPISELESFGR